MNNLFRIHLVAAVCIISIPGRSQVRMSPEPGPKVFQVMYEVPASAVKSQGNTGTCWCYSGTSLLESQFLSSKQKEIDLSEMYTVRNMYVEKARNYVLRQGKAQFSEGALGHDVIRSARYYGLMPESAYSGLLYKTMHDHSVLSAALKSYVDSVVQVSPKPITRDWMHGYELILDEYLGKVPDSFSYGGKRYSPVTFSRDVLGFHAGDYVNMTSFTHHPYYSSFILEVPDNFSNGSYFNLPMTEMTDLVEDALKKGYSVMWDADVSNDEFRQQSGLALMADPKSNPGFDPSGPEWAWSPGLRQQLFETLVTQDDHLMHIVGLYRTANGKKFFKVKNSWGNIGPFEGYIMVSESYFAINTISIVLPRASLSREWADRVGLP